MEDASGFQRQVKGGPPGGSIGTTTISSYTRMNVLIGIIRISSITLSSRIAGRRLESGKLMRQMGTK